MGGQTNEARALVETGFQVGLDADKAPGANEMLRYKHDYVLGFVVGRSISESVQRASREAGAVVAGQLAARYSLPMDRLLAELEFTQELREQVRNACEAKLRSVSKPDGCD
ncbi:DUF2623 family protein [Paraburkholderia sp. RL18-101-BIB-B]|uniref:DUF2623 family protein n=1 Tax=Paraburkholderia sp. RL18-101-BIB-B TaxID=3031634 RepID=UPI0038B8B733